MQKYSPVLDRVQVPSVMLTVQDADNNWQFDIFAFAAATPGATLSLLTFHFLKQTGVTEQWGHDEVKLCRFLQRVVAGYKPSNPYHNRSLFTGLLTQSSSCDFDASGFALGRADTRLCNCHALHSLLCCAICNNKL